MESGQVGVSLLQGFPHPENQPLWVCSQTFVTHLRTSFYRFESTEPGIKTEGITPHLSIKESGRKSLESGKLRPIGSKLYT